MFLVVIYQAESNDAMYGGSHWSVAYGFLSEAGGFSKKSIVGFFD
jgi:hypothetical protein